MPQYRKLSRKRKLVGGRDTVFAADDHLLLAKSNGYTAEYRRFFYRDIQYITVRKTIAGTVAMIILGAFILAGIFLIVLAWRTTLLGNRDIAIGGLAIFVVALMVWLVVDLFRGATAKVVVKTFSQPGEMFLTGRFRSSVRLVDRQIWPLINAAQADLAAAAVAGGGTSGGAVADGGHGEPVPEGGASAKRLDDSEAAAF